MNIRYNKLIKCICGCGSEFFQFDNKGRERKYKAGHNSITGRKHSPESLEKMRKASKKGEKNYFWNGGKYRMKSGYICIWIPEHPFANNDGYVLEHRLVMEKHIGRYLTKEEVIHHINGKKDDNRIDNLELCANQKEHLKRHIKKGVKGYVSSIHGFSSR